MGKPMVKFFPFHHSEIKIPTGNSDGLKILKQRFQKQSGEYFINGGTALDWLVGEKLNLKRKDEIWIVTTFDFPNVSSCVTSTIFNHCKPSRVLTENTKAILVIHEFGVPHSDIQELKAISDDRNIPLIEDCAHTIDSHMKDTLMGTIGNWTLLSLPKVFPITLGGALLGPDMQYKPTDFDLRNLTSISDGVDYFVKEISSQSKLRRTVYRKISNIVKKYGLEVLFDVPETVSPWFVPVKTNKWQEYLEKGRQMDIDIARWHGSDMIILPCHQCLSKKEFQQLESLIQNAEC